MYVAAIYSLLFRFIYPIIIIIAGIILYSMLNSRNKPTLLAIAFIVYGIMDVLAVSILLIALMNVSTVVHSGWDTVSYISLVNAISSIIHLAALIVFVVLVIIGVNRILEKETIAPAPYSKPS